MKTFRIAILFILSFAVAALPAFGAEPQFGLREVVLTVENSYKQLEYLTADFVQRSTLAGKDRELRADGEMLLRKSPQNEGGFDDRLKFRFDYFRPTRHEIVCNGETLWMYLPESRKVIKSDVSYLFNRSSFGRGSFGEEERATNFLQGLGRISKDFQIHFSPQMRDVEGNYILELSPRRSSVSISKLFMVVDAEAVKNFAIKKTIEIDPRYPRRNFPVLSTTVIDPRGNTTTMEFSNQSDRRIMDGLFEFMIPPGVQVEQPRRK